LVLVGAQNKLIVFIASLSSDNFRFRRHIEAIISRELPRGGHKAICHMRVGRIGVPTLPPLSFLLLSGLFLRRHGGKIMRFSLSDGHASLRDDILCFFFNVNGVLTVLASSIT
jgi:hypothetical protein